MTLLLPVYYSLPSENLCIDLKNVIMKTPFLSGKHSVNSVQRKNKDLVFETTQ